MALAFDASYYLSQNPDVAAAISRGTVQSAEQHYNDFGRFESRNPNAFFNTAFYLAQYPDVAAARVNPFQHFLANGASEGRLASSNEKSLVDLNGNGNGADDFNATKYVADYPDVGTAIANGTLKSAYQHFVVFGQFEGRSATLSNGTIISGPIAGSGASTSFALTGATDNLVGTSGNDTFVGDYSIAGQVSAADSVNGGAGIDTVNLFGATSTSALPQLSNVEVLNFNAPATGFTGANVSAINGLTTVGLVNSALATTFTVSANQDVSYTNVTGATAQGIITTATDTAITITANNSTLGAVAVTGAAATTLTVANNGTGASTIASLSSTADETTVNLSGNQGITITGALATTVTKVDASANTGGVSVVLAGGDVSVTGGAGNDKFAFGTSLSSADAVVGGAGTDTVTIDGVDLTADANATQLLALNTKVTGVEVLEFAGSNAATITGGTGTGAFTNTEITKLLFNTADAATDTINNAGATRTYAFGDANSGAAAFNLAQGNNTVNVSLEATATATTGGAEVGGITVTANTLAPAGQTAIVNIASTGPGTVVNSTGALAAATGSVFNVTGSHDLTIDSLTRGGTVDASTFTGKLIVTGSAVNDAIIGGTGNDIINGSTGIDTIDLSKGGQDIVRFGQTAAADRDIVTGFSAGVNGDILDVGTQNATLTTNDQVGTAQFREITTTSATYAFTTANTVNEFAFNAVNNSANLANATDGTELLKAIAGQGTTVTGITAQAGTDAGTIVAYQNGNAYIYHYDAGGDTTISATEVTLIGTLNNVAVGALTHDNFA